MSLIRPGSRGEFKEYPTIFRGRLGFKGIAAPEIVRGYTIDIARVLPGDVMRTHRKTEGSGSHEVFTYTIEEIYEKALARSKIPTPHILLADDDLVFRLSASPNNPHIVGVVSKSGITSHGFVVLRQFIESENPSGIIAVGAVQDFELIPENNQMEIDASNPQDVIIKLLK